MKKSLLSAIGTGLLLLSIFGMLAVDSSKANPLPREKPHSPPPITIHSPLNNTRHNDSVLLNFTIVGISHYWILAYHLTDVYYECDGKSAYLYRALNNNEIGTNAEHWSTLLTGLTQGEHTLTVHAYGSGRYLSNYLSSELEEYSIESTQTVIFTVIDDTSPSPSLSPSPTLTSSPSPSPTLTPTPIPTLEKAPISSVFLSESASALNYGNTVNFTVSTNGGVPPYNYTWYLDGSATASTSSPYYSLNAISIGSHHVYVEVKDANGNSATTLTVEFNVLPTSSTSPSPSPTQPPTAEPTLTASLTPSPPRKDHGGLDSMTLLIIVSLGAFAILVGAAFALRKQTKLKKVRNANS